MVSGLSSKGALNSLWSPISMFSTYMWCLEYTHACLFMRFEVVIVVNISECVFVTVSHTGTCSTLMPDTNMFSSFFQSLIYV